MNMLQTSRISECQSSAVHNDLSGDLTPQNTDSRIVVIIIILIKIILILILVIMIVVVILILLRLFIIIGFLGM